LPAKQDVFQRGEIVAKGRLTMDAADAGTQRCTR